MGFSIYYDKQLSFFLENFSFIITQVSKTIRFSDHVFYRTINSEN